MERSARACGRGSASGFSEHPGHPLVLGPAEKSVFSLPGPPNDDSAVTDFFKGILGDARMESAEEARRRSSAAASAACVESAATAAGAFDASGLTVYLKDVMTLCLENRPSDPVAFVAEYLRRVTRGASPVSRACQYLRLAPHHRREFVDNAVIAHAELCGGARGGPKEDETGVDPEDHLAVLRKLCAHLPPSVAETAARATRAEVCGRARDDERFRDARTSGVDVFAFVASVRACLAFEELLGDLEEAARRGASAFDASRPMAREALLKAAEDAVGGSERGGGRDARADAFLEAVDVALRANPGPAVTFERFASELFVAMTAEATTE